MFKLIQRPLVDTRIMNIINLNKIPSGCMVVVAIMTYSGFNQEDSIIFNKDSLDRVVCFQQRYIILKKMKIRRYKEMKKLDVSLIKQKRKE